jgi:thiol-disulfide isomerase/thioredoxin
MFRLALLTTLFSFVFGAAAVFAHPSVFSDLSFADAAALAQKENKLLIVDFVAVWCEPCHAMDSDTWPEPHLLAWIKANAIALQIDVDKETKIAEKYRIDGMPTIVVFNPKANMAEMQRQGGYQEASQLMDWLKEVKTGKDTVQSLEEEVADAQTKGDEESESKARFELAKTATNRMQFPVATEQYLWLTDRCLSGKPVHPNLMEMAFGMHKLVARDSSARAQFLAIRNQMQGKNRVNWCVLNSVLDDNDSILRWFEEAKLDPNQKEDLKDCANLIALLLLREKRWGEITYLYPEPLESIKMTEAKSKTDEEQYMLCRKIAFLYATYLAIGKDDIANSIADYGFKFSNTKTMREMLLYDAVAARQFRPVQLVWYLETLKWNELVLAIIVGGCLSVILIGLAVNLVREKFLHKG